MAGGTFLFDRLLEPYLVLDSRLVAVADNAAYRAIFCAVHGSAYDDAQLREKDRVIDALVETLRPGETEISTVFRFDVPGAPVPEGPDGNRGHYWQVHASYLTAGASGPSLITLRFDDVTSRTLAQARERGAPSGSRSAPAKEREQFEDCLDPVGQALAFAGIGTWEMDIVSGQARWSEQCARHMGIGPADVLTPQMLLGDDGNCIAAGEAAPASQLSFECERMVQSPQGRRWVLVRGIGRVDAGGAVRPVVGFTLDITRRKQDELELGARADAERSAREHSEALTATMDQFVAGVSHELRSPLNAIIAWAEVLQLSTDPSNVTRAGEAIRRNGRQLSHMVDDLLDSGAIATGKLSVNLQPVDLGMLAAIVAEDVRKQAERKQVGLRAVDISACMIMGDESRMKQVIWNLLSNAVKFTDAGTIEISVRAMNRHAEMTVRDTGRGIDADTLPLVFDRFQQVAPRSSGRIGGLGLGLWLVKNIVGLHGGTVAASSEGPGRGSTFTVRIPLATRGPAP